MFREYYLNVRISRLKPVRFVAACCRASRESCKRMDVPGICLGERHEVLEKPHHMFEKLALEYEVYVGKIIKQ